MTKTSSTIEESQSLLQNEAEQPVNPEGQILHLKRLLVTLKQQYEKGLKEVQERLYAERFQKYSLQEQLKDSAQMHEEEMKALREQQSVLHHLLKETQEEVKQYAERPWVLPHVLDSMKELEGIARELKEKNEAVNLENCLLKEEAEKSRSKIEELEAKAQEQKAEAYPLQLDSATSQESKTTNSSETDLEERVGYLEGLLNLQNQDLFERGEEYVRLADERESLENHIQELREILDESESRLMIAQQHLAKKVKEAALLTETAKSQANCLEEASQNAERLNSELNVLKSLLEDYQNKEMHWQRLHEALKGSEAQAARWEEKYFQMHEKWQQSEIRNKELKDLEEKYQHIQALLANLGNFMGTPKSVVSKIEEPAFCPPFSFNSAEEQYDFFGMKIEKLKPDFFDA